MDTLILNPKAEFLLGAGLNVLHFESKEWLDTIDLWKDEVRFFENLLNKKEASNNNNSEYKQMLKNLDQIHRNLFEDLEEKIIKHEQLLSDIELNKRGLSDNDYREQHLHINTEMNTFKNDFKTFKRVVFDYAKNLE